MRIEFHGSDKNKVCVTFLNEYKEDDKKKKKTDVWRFTLPAMLVYFSTLFTLLIIWSVSCQCVVLIHGLSPKIIL